MAVIRSPYVCWRADPLWKRALRHRTAGSATAPMCAVLGHHKRLRLGKIKDLTGVVIAAGCLGQRLGAVCAICRQVIDGVVGIVDRAKGFPRMSLLPAGWFFRPLSQAAGAGRLLTQPVARRRLAAVRTVQPQAALQLHHPRHQRGILMAHRGVLCRKRSPFAGEHRILCDKSLNACLQDCNGRPIAGCIGGLLWNTETRLGRCHRRG